MAQPLRFHGAEFPLDLWCRVNTRTRFDDQQQSNDKEEMSMSPKLKRYAITEPQATSTQAEPGEVSVGNSARDEEIRRRAYEIYLERELDDWLQAERELERGVLRRAQAG